MLIDARALPDGHQLEVDLCIVGSGPAGLTVAHELGNTNLSICILESGPRQPAPATEQLNETLVEDGDLTAPIESRARALGGTSHRWNIYSDAFDRGVRLLPFSPIDFETRSWVPDSGWPFAIDELQPFEERARGIAGLPSAASDPADVASSERPLLPLPAGRVKSTVEWFTPARRFHEQLPGAVEDHERVTILTHATATAVTTHDTSTAVSGIDARTLEGQTLSVRARRVVLAAGGIENARLLLASRESHPEGLGNGRDLVGRYYMDHLKLIVADFTPSDRTLIDRMKFYDIHQRDGATLAGKLQLSDDAQRDAQILNAVVRFEPRPSDAVSGTATAAWRLASDLRRRRRPSTAVRNIVSHPRSWPRLAALGLELSRRQRQRVPSLTHGWAQLAQPSRHLEKFILEIQIELAPEASNRVTLSNQRDPLGQQLPAVTWRWGDLERRTVEETIRELNRNFEQAGLGSVLLRDTEDIEMMTPAGDNHPTGTTRMHRDPAHGVVNEHGRVHGIENLYVTGSSVFPTSGYANPTLTIIAMAARLADHLARSR